jgi:nucleoside diphosphate kinase
MSESAKEKFKALYGKSVDEVKVLGGIEFLKLYPDFNAVSLDFFWQNKNCDKLAGGTYSMEMKIDSEKVYLVNGFHPRQLEQFTAKGRSIVVMTLSGNAGWASARTEFIGSTAPQNALEGSIRRELLNHKDELGLDEVSQGLNGVHLSAGPVEGLVELIRYNSDFSDNSRIRQIGDFAFGKTLLNRFNSEQVAAVISNRNVSVDGKSVSVFDLTEEKDSDEAIEILAKYI